jgi:hypothetical protein
MLLSFVLLGGFLYWLSATAEPTQPPVMVEEDDEDGGMTGTTVQPGMLAATPQDYEGQTVRVADVAVPQAVGPRAFFVELTSQSPFLVRMDSSLVARGMEVPSGQTVTVIGTVHAMNDSIATAWESAGDITAGERPLVDFATHFILAQQVRARPAAGGNPG